MKQWYFNEARPGDRARESQVEKFFRSDAVQNRANALVREGIQNSLDAAREGSPVTVRIGLYELNTPATMPPLSRLTAGLFDHIDAVRSRLADPPLDSEPCRFLVFEDFGTTGLRGDPAQWWPDERHSNPFFNFFRGEGISDKEQGNRGRHGVGKFVFAAASRARAILALTRRDDGRRLLMGTTVLRLHSIDGVHYMPDGWFGVRNGDQLVLPIENDPLIDRFAADFHLTRTASEDGLSIVVPWLEASVDAAAVTDAVIRGYFHPIMRGELAVEVRDSNGVTAINATTIKDVVVARGGQLQSDMAPVLALVDFALSQTTPPELELHAPGKPKWDVSLFSEDLKKRLQKQIASGDRVAVRVPIRIRPQGRPEQLSHFDVFFVRDPDVDDGQILFIREGIIVSDIRPRRCPGFRGLVVIDEGPLAAFLGDAENPSHTQWQKDLVRGRYSFHTSTLAFVIESITSIVRILDNEEQQADPSLLLDLFYLPADQPTALQAGRPRPDRRPAGTTPPVPPIPPARPKRYRIVQTDGGFVVRPGDPGAATPPALEIVAAYGVRRGSPFKRYRSNDFSMARSPIHVAAAGATITEKKDNRLRVRIDERDFEIYVTGFDPKRDLETKVTVLDSPDAAAAAGVDDNDADGQEEV